MKIKRLQPIQESWWRLQKELFSRRVDLSFGNFFRSEELPQLHYCVAERYWRLADYWERRGWTKNAQAYRTEAKKHLRLSGLKLKPPPDEPPFAAATAMPVPEEPIFTEAVGKSPCKKSAGGRSSN